MELTTYKPGVTLNLNHFDEVIIRRDPYNFQSVGHQSFFILSVKLVAMTMPFGNFGLAVSPESMGTRREHTGIGTEPHGASQVIDAPQFSELVDDPMWRGGIEL